MLSRHKYSLIATACAATFAVTPILATENVKTESTINPDSQPAQMRAQHIDYKNKYDQKKTGKHADHREHEKPSKILANYADRIASYAEALGLSDEQLGKIIRLHQRSSKQNSDIMQQVHKSMKALRKASSNPATDDELLRKYAKEHADAVTRLAEERIAHRKAMRAILTDEQFNKLKSMKMHDNQNEGDAEAREYH